MLGVVASLRARGRLLVETLECRVLVERATYGDREVARDATLALTVAERALLERLSSLIVPGDERVAGAGSVGVVATIERHIGASAVRRGEYGRGLPAIDAMARQRHQRPFLALTEAEQIALLEALDRASRRQVTRRLGRLGPRLQHAIRIIRSPAVHLFPVLVRDVIDAYYATPAAWSWLEYDGPPSPRGYSDVLRPRVE